jgi:hypothetical protein
MSNEGMRVQFLALRAVSGQYLCQEFAFSFSKGITMPVHTVQSMMLSLLAVVAAGCTTAPPPVTRTAAAGSDIECHNETITGSHLSTRVCMTRAEREMKEANAKEMRERMSLPGAVSCGQANQMGCPHD